eukprot:SAG22_NODE_371_length_11566_cov_5.447458_9_plen_128_part_00
MWWCVPTLACLKLFVPKGKPAEFVGQFVGLVLGKSLSEARTAAALCKLSYGPPVPPQGTTGGANPLSLEAALAAGAEPHESFPPVHNPGCTEVNEVNEVGGGEPLATVQGKISSNGQKHFYMETDST